MVDRASGLGFRGAIGHDSTKATFRGGLDLLSLADPTPTVPSA